VNDPYRPDDPYCLHLNVITSDIKANPTNVIVASETQINNEVSGRFGILRWSMNRENLVTYEKRDRRCRIGLRKWQVNRNRIWKHRYIFHHTHQCFAISLHFTHSSVPLLCSTCKNLYAIACAWYAIKAENCG